MTGVVPVVLFAYRRPDLLGRTLETLRANDVPLIVAYSDGPRTAEDEAGVAASRAMLDGVRWTRVEHIARPVNFGLGRSIVEGMTEALQRFDAAICCEDDLHVVPGAYRWIVAALERYAADARVMSVSGWTHARLTPAGVGDQPYFSGRVNTLFWGTWRERWRGMERGTAGDRLAQVVAAGGDPERYGCDLPQYAAVEAQRNLWAIRWVTHHLAAGALSLCPPWTLAEHIGYDPRATNAVSDPSWVQEIPMTAPPIPASWPEPVEHPEIAALWRAAARADMAVAPRPSFWQRVRRRVGRMLGG